MQLLVPQEGICCLDCWYCWDLRSSGLLHSK